MKNRGVICDRLSERGGCFQCFDPFLLNLELGEQAFFPPQELITNDREQTVMRNELACEYSSGRMERREEMWNWGGRERWDFPAALSGPAP